MFKQILKEQFERKERKNRKVVNRQNDEKLELDKLQDQKSIFTLMSLLHDYLFERFDVSFET